jgi:hypothetical protein
MNNKNSIPAEDNDSCFNRLTRNWKNISKGMYPTKIICKHCYWDKDNSRIYQFDFEKVKQKQNSYFRLNTFRQDCNRPLITL